MVISSGKGGGGAPVSARFLLAFQSRYGWIVGAVLSPRRLKAARPTPLFWQGAEKVAFPA
jgi:hypothetical protein